MITFKEFLEAAQSEAIAAKVSPTEESLWRSICRYYSKTFHTPLSEVENMDAELVALAYYEDRMDNWETEERIVDILDMIYSLEDPNYDIKKEQQLREADKRMLEQEKDRIERGEAIHFSIAEGNQKNTSKKPKEPPKDLPKEGYVNLSYMEEDDSKESGEF